MHHLVAAPTVIEPSAHIAVPSGPALGTLTLACALAASVVLIPGVLPEPDVASTVAPDSGTHRPIDERSTHPEHLDTHTLVGMLALAASPEGPCAGAHHPPGSGPQPIAASAHLAWQSAGMSLIASAGGLDAERRDASILASAFLTGALGP